MSENNNYQSHSTANWLIPGDVPGRSQLYGTKAEDDDDFDSSKANTNTAASPARAISDEFYKNQLVKSLSKQTQNISRRVTEITKKNKKHITQPLAILLLIMAGMFLSLPEFDNQITLKSNESFAANNLKAAPNDETIVSDHEIIPAQKETIYTKFETTNQKTRLLKLTSKPVSKSRIINHTVVKGDTLWDIAEFYVKDPFRYPELAKLSNIVTPDLIYPGNIISIQI